MKIDKPAESVEVCDFCHRESFLEVCDVCGKSFCYICTGIVIQSWGFTNLCRECCRRDDVKEVCAIYSRLLTPIFKRRNVALRKLHKSNKGDEKDRRK